MALWPGLETAPTIALSYVRPSLGGRKIDSQVYEVMFAGLPPMREDGTWSYDWSVSGGSGGQSSVGCSVFPYYAQPVGFGAGCYIAGLPVRSPQLDRFAWSADMIASAGAVASIEAPRNIINTVIARVQNDYETPPPPGTLIDPNTDEPYTWYLMGETAMDGEQYYCVWSRTEIVLGGAIKLGLAKLTKNSAGDGFDLSLLRAATTSFSIDPDDPVYTAPVDLTAFAREYVRHASTAAAFVLFAMPGNISMDWEDLDGPAGAESVLDLIDQCATNGLSFQEIDLVGHPDARYAIGTAVARTLEYSNVSLQGINVKLGGAVPLIGHAPINPPPRMDWIV
jgi:hypothetical protein